MDDKLIAYVPGDGAGPEMMEVAWNIAVRAALLDSLNLKREYTPMGWCALKEFGDTLPDFSFKRAVEIGTIFFGGVGDPKWDDTVGLEKPKLKPEARCLLPIRKEMGLLLNFRPMAYYKELDFLANVKPETIPDEGIFQHWIRCLLEDTYFGTSDLIGIVENHGNDIAELIGLKLKKDVSGNEEIISELSYYRKETIEKYFRFAFQYAEDLNLPLISIDKSNVMPRYDFWKKIVTRIGAEEFPNVPLRHQLVDSANALLFTPAELHGVIACGNEHGDILSDGAAGALGSMGMMCSSAINPETGAAMFESGAGTAPTLAGQDKANPIGRILTAAMMLRHIGAINGALVIENAVKQTLKNGYRTGDLFSSIRDDAAKLVGTIGMGEQIIKNM